MTGTRHICRSSFIIHHSSFRPRGVLLLLILALLSMFGLIAVAFVVITGQAQRSAKSIERIGLVSDPPQKLLGQAAMQVFRGSNNPASVMRAHSLLEGMYGNNSATGTITLTMNNPVCGGQLIEFTIIPAPTSPAMRIGCVITVNDPGSPLNGQSSRIVGFNPDTGDPQMLAFDGQTPADNTTVTINGVPFSGTGFGYNLNTRKLDLGCTNIATTPTLDTSGIFSATNLPVALLPNLPLSVYYNVTTNPRSNPHGGANSDYTAADFQHMLLAAQVPDGGAVKTLPSFHRTALCRHWANIPVASGGLGISPPESIASWDAGLNSADKVALLRQIMMRPVGQFTASTNTTHVDHPNFTGSNPNFNPGWDGVTPGQGQWDVDNDGDGVTDSVWVDLGLPVRSTSDGRLYKPLFAILCTDLDGRLNVNAHGCLAQTYAAYTDRVSAPVNQQFAGVAVNDPTPVLPRGMGYGPAEVNLTSVLGQTVFKQLLERRYPDTALVPGWIGGDAGRRLNLNRWFLYGGDYWNPANVDAYGSPPDLLGTAAVGLDYGGKPIYAIFGPMRIPTMGQRYDTLATAVQCPYEYDLSAKRPRGASDPVGNVPYSAAELERILRPYDRDATSLPARLAQATALDGVTPSDSVLLKLGLGGLPLRNAVTTDSWDLPCPSAALSAEMLTAGVTDPLDRSELLGLLPTHHVADVLKALLIKKARTASPKIPAAVFSVTDAEAILPGLFAPELLAGRKMDLNRAFGNGRDDSSPPNGVVDEPWPPDVRPDLNEYVSLYTAPDQTTRPQFPVVYDPTATAGNSLKARQLHARHLYMLAMVLVDTHALKNQLGPPAIPHAPPATDDEVARFLAQWAVNVVDFYDRDSIMTPFQYDPTPFTSLGWNAPIGDLPDADDPFALHPANLVWGCERPELLITETLALHDRRVQNVPVNAGGPVWSEVLKTLPEPDPTTWKGTFSQWKKPQGSLFIELYNPWTDREPLPRELTDNATNTGVDLSKIVPITGDPVWQIVIVPGNAAAEDPDPDFGLPTQSVLRSIRFTNNPGPGTEQFITLAPRPIRPGRYAVIGSAKFNAGVPDPNDETTYLGRLATVPNTDDTEPTDVSNTRQIRLDLVGSTGTPVFNNRPTEYTAAPPEPYPDPRDVTNPQPRDAHILPCVRIPVSSPRRLNISEPDGGYGALSPAPGADGKYNPILPTPVDYYRTDAVATAAISTNGTTLVTALRRNGTTPNMVIVHLQRLANPLREYDEIQNPYRTIDSMPVDLIAFNGWDESDEIPENMWGFGAMPGTMLVASHQRGEPTIVNPTPMPNALWAERLEPKFLEDPPQVILPTEVMPTHRFPYILRHSLGFMNRSLSFAVGRKVICPRRTTTPNLGDPDGSRWPEATWRSPAFPWLTWGNRPFVSQLELMLAPWAKSSQLCQTFLVVSTADPYNNASMPFAPFSHLLNVFRSSASDESTTAPQFHRLLEFLHVPSRFVGTEIEADPTAAGFAADKHVFHTPFNQIPTYREPGRVNLNTIYSEEVYRGLLNNNPAMGPIWDDFQRSRRGYPAIADPNDYPTEFSRPFRSFAGASMAPVGFIPLREIEATLLRPHPINTTQPLFSFTSTIGYNETQRNPFFRYQALQRLGNLVTTRSNVYAVWITVGYFEVEPVSVANPAVYPDGYRLSRELGVDTGEIERHRAFYIFDRTIPVGFQRGQDWNVEKAILVKRFIE